MSTILEQAVESILDNYADVIEGGNTHRGSGTKYKGIPGFESFDPLIAEVGTFEPDGLGSQSTTFLDYTNTLPSPGRAFRSNGPPFFALMTGTSGGATGNVGAARKITNWTSSGVTLDVALPETPQNGDQFVLREGFFRAPDNWDLESEAAPPEGFSRAFRLRMIPGREIDWSGNGTRWYESELELRIGLEKRSRDRQIIDSLLRNLTTMRAIIVRGDHRDSTYVQRISAQDTAPEIAVETEKKVVVLDKYAVTYRVQDQFL